MGKSARWIKKILGLKKKSSKEKSPVKNPESNQILAKPPLPLNESAKILLQQQPPSAAPPKGEASLPAPPPSAKFQDRQIQCTDDVQEDAKHTESDAGDEDVFPKVSSQEDLAAVKIQKAFRCYLSRRALRALRSVIRLQALARGHAVRRQAAAALRSVQAIVRVQAIFRGRQVRLSEEGQAIQYLLQRYRQETDSWQLADQEPYPYRVNSTKEADKALAYALQRQVEWSKAEKKPPYIDSALESGSGWGWLQRWTAARPWALSSLEAGEQHPGQAELNPDNPVRQAEVKPELSPCRPSNTSEAVQEEKDPPVFIPAPEKTESQAEVKTPGLRDDEDDTPNLEGYLPEEMNELEKSGVHEELELGKKANGHYHGEEEDNNYTGAFEDHHHRHHLQQQQQQQQQEGEEEEENADEQEEHREFDDDDDDDEQQQQQEEELMMKSGHGFDDEHHLMKGDENDDKNSSNNNNSNNGSSPHHLMIPQQQHRSVPSYMAATQSAKAKVRAQSPKSTSPGVKRRFSVSGKASLESSPSTGSTTATPRRLSLPGNNNSNNNNNNEGSGSPRRVSMSNGSPQTRSSGKSKPQENGVRRSTELRKSFRF